MLEKKFISSPNNSLVKKMVQLRDKKKERIRTGTFILEGYRELEMAVHGKYTILNLFFNKELCPRSKIEAILDNNFKEVEFIEVSSEVYQKLAYRDSTEGILAVVKAKTHSLQELELPENPLLLVAEAPEKPGNIGALLRTADAAGIDAVLIANPKSDLYNSNIIRSSVGCVFTVPIAMGSTLEIISFLKQKNINIYAAALSANTNYSDIDYTAASAIVVGTEDTGLSELWLNEARQQIIIPMRGTIDSMNVSVSAAILIFEARRQRSLY